MPTVPTSRRAAKSAAAKSSAAPKGKKPPAKTAVPKPSRARGPGKAAAPYHHGDLRHALLLAAEKILDREGLPALTLRAVAREAGVSHAAPAHHFGDLAGLCSELAAVGFHRFNEAMQQASTEASTPAEQALARGHAYVAYARAHPGLYQLMFRTDRMDLQHPALNAAASLAFSALARNVGTVRNEPIDEDALSLAQAAAIAQVWSTMHGFTMLLLDGRLDDLASRVTGGADTSMLLDTMLAAWRSRPV